jgi:galactose-1-phosphate uridylyltransferase
LDKIIGAPVSDKDYDPECPFCPGNETRFPSEEQFRINILGGFERGTRIQVITILPEESAHMLRECRNC